MKSIVTISRQFGSGGHTIGKLAAERLGFPFYDQEIIERVMERTGLSGEYIQETGEYASKNSSFMFNLALASSVNSTNPVTPYDKVFLAQNKVILDIAKHGPCVIVGRCADYILKSREDCLRIFIFADEESRAKWINERYPKQKGKTTEERIAQMDQRRELYYKHYTGSNWGELSNYHLAIYSSVVGIERCVDWIEELVLDRKV